MTSRLILVIGDLFIPDRAPDIPAKFRKLLTPGKIGQTLCLGNVTDRPTLEFLRSIAPDLQLVKGDFDVELPLGTASPSAAAAAAASSSSASSYVSPSSSSFSSSFALPLSKVVTAPSSSLRIGLTHGHTVIPPADPDALLIAARQMDVDVLVWGGTHRFEAYEVEGRFFVNPGSATGAFTGSAAAVDLDREGGEGVTPSFCLMDVQGDVLVLYVYQLKTDESGTESVSVEKVSFRKSIGS